MTALQTMYLGRRAGAETIGTAFLLAAIVGSGIMGDQLGGGNVAIALLANTVATGAALVALIMTFGPISGAHFNPVVTALAAIRGDAPWRDVPAYIAAQLAGAFFGVAAAHVMFSQPMFATSAHVRAGVNQVEAEAIATFGLLTVIRPLALLRPRRSFNGSHQSFVEIIGDDENRTVQRTVSLHRQLGSIDPG